VVEGVTLVVGKVGVAAAKQISTRVGIKSRGDGVQACRSWFR
jgi:hypothetical protein